MFMGLTQRVMVVPWNMTAKWVLFDHASKNLHNQGYNHFYYISHKLLSCFFRSIMSQLNGCLKDLAFPSSSEWRGKKPSHHPALFRCNIYSSTVSQFPWCCNMFSAKPTKYFFTATISILLKNKAITKTSAASILAEGNDATVFWGDGSFSPYLDFGWVAFCSLHSWCTLFMVLG